MSIVLVGLQLHGPPRISTNTSSCAILPVPRDEVRVDILVRKQERGVDILEQLDLDLVIENQTKTKKKGGKCSRLEKSK
jgi:hypothetical protein